MQRLCNTQLPAAARLRVGTGAPPPGLWALPVLHSEMHVAAWTRIPPFPRAAHASESSARKGHLILAATRTRIGYVSLLPLDAGSGASASVKFRGTLPTRAKMTLASTAVRICCSMSRVDLLVPLSRSATQSWHSQVWRSLGGNRPCRLEWHKAVVQSPGRAAAICVTAAEAQQNCKAHPRAWSIARSD